MQPNIQTALAERTDQPKDYERLTTAMGDALAAWIATTMHAIKAANLYQTSSTLKAVFKRSAGGFYITNGQFKGAMLAAGYQPIDAKTLNWTFHIRRVRV
jgi:hypothetical protein